MKKLAILLPIVLSIVSCRKEETRWMTDVAGPVAYGRIGLDDLLEDSLLASDELCLWHIVFSRNLADLELDSLVEIPDTTIHKNFDVPLTGGPWELGPNITLITLTEDNALQLPSVSLREVIADGGTLEYEVRSYVNGYLHCTYSMPGLSLNGAGTVIDVTTTPSTGDVPSIASGAIDLTGYSLDLTGQSGTSFNELTSHLLIKTAEDAPTSAIVFGDDSVVVHLRFVEPRVRYARGYFGQHAYELNEQSSFGDDIPVPQGLLSVVGTEVGLRLENYSGIDAQIDFEHLRGSKEDGSTIDLSFAPLFAPINVTRAEDNGGIVTPTIHSWSLDDGNSSIGAFIGFLPTAIELGGDAVINPLGDVSDGNDFIYPRRALELWLDVDVPLNVGMQDLVLRDTLDVDVSGELTASGSLIVYAGNTFPVGATMTLEILGGSVVLTDGAIAPGTPAVYPAVSEPVMSQLTCTLGEADVEALRSNGKIAVRISLSTPGYPEVIGLYKTQYIDLRIVADGSIGITID